MMLSGCALHTDTSNVETSPPSAEVYLDVVSWEDVENQFIEKETELNELEKSGYTPNEEETKDLINQICKEYNNFANGINGKLVPNTLTMYECGRKLEMSDDSSLQSLGQSAIAYILSYYGFTAEDGVVAYTNLYANLIVYSDLLEDEPIEAKGYDELYPENSLSETSEPEENAE